MSPRNVLLLAVLVALASAAWFAARGLTNRAGTPARATEGQAAASGEADEEEPPLAPAAESTSSRRANATAPERAPPTKRRIQPDTPVRARVRVVRRQDRGELAPVPGASVGYEVSLAEDKGLFQALGGAGKTDEQGLFSIRVHAPGNWTLLAVDARCEVSGRPWRGRVSGALPTSADIPIEIELLEVPPRLLRVRVLDRDSLEPVVGAELSFASAESPKRTDALGTAQLALHPSFLGVPCVTVAAAGWYPTTACGDTRENADRRFGWGRRGGSILLATPQGPDADIVVLVTRSARLEGVVFDARGVGIPSATITTSFTAGIESFAPAVKVTSTADDRGRFIFEALPSGRPCELEVNLRGESGLFEREPLLLEPGETRHIELRVRRHVELSGRVIGSDEKPVTEGHVEIDVGGVRDRGSIRADGTYYLPFAAAGTGWLCVWSPGEAEPRTRVLTSIPRDVVEWTIDVRIQPTTTIAGVLLDAEGHPVSGRVVIEQPGMPPEESLVQGNRGAFEFHGLTPGEYTVTGFEDHLALQSLPVVVLAGDRNVLVRLPGTGKLRGRVTDASGSPLPGASVSLELARRDSLLAPSRQDGTFEFDVAAGPARVHATNGSLAAPPIRVEIAPGAETSVVDLVLVRCSAIRLVTGAEPASVDVEVRTESTTWFQGTLTARTEHSVRVPPGRAVVLLSSATRAPRELAIEVPDQGELFVPLRGAP